MTYWDYLVTLFQIITGPAVVTMVVICLVLASVGVVILLLGTKKPWDRQDVAVFIAALAVILLGGPFAIWSVNEIDPGTYWHYL